MLLTFFMTMPLIFDGSTDVQGGFAGQYLKQLGACQILTNHTYLCFLLQTIDMKGKHLFRQSHVTPLTLTGPAPCCSL